ncbi:MAG: hypothetical protein QXR89_08020 [Candidatus Bathyarchaeia archaeon]
MSRIRKFLATLYHAFFNFVLNSFKSINRKIRSKLPVWRMKEETREHVQSSIKVFKWIILPASLLYIFLEFYFFGENALDTMLWGLAVFFYSNFLPDLPSIYRRKAKNNGGKDLSWYKRYAILLFAPLLVWILFSGIRLNWRTTETYSVYCVFLFFVGFFAFVKFPVRTGNFIKILVFPLYGLAGYLTHLKVDKIW